MEKKKKISSFVSEEQAEVGLATKEDIARFKSIFYVLNGKPDTEVKILKSKKKITLSDINDLNTRVIDKLNNHHVVVSLIHVSVSLSDKRKLNFGNWDEFKQQKWDTAASVNQVSMQWDFCLKLPGYPVPQRHTLKVRMGSQVKPKELFQIIMGDEVGDLELDEATANVVCKIDFVNIVISHELLNLVTEWHESLRPLAKETKIELFFMRHNVLLAEAVALLFPMAAVSFSYTIFKYILGGRELNSTLIDNLLLGALVSAIIILFANFVGKRFKIRILHAIDRFNLIPIFQITRGDRNKIAEIKSKNNTVFKDLFINLLAGILSNAVSVGVNFLHVFKK